jgi:hypothetical protein
LIDVFFFRKKGRKERKKRKREKGKEKKKKKEKESSAETIGRQAAIGNRADIHHDHKNQPSGYLKE